MEPYIDSYGIRWLAWASYWTSEHPEIYTAQSLRDDPAWVATSLLLYFISGLILEFIYRKLTA